MPLRACVPLLVRRKRSSTVAAAHQREKTWR